MRPISLCALLYAAAFFTLVRAGHRDDALRTLGYLLMFAVLTILTRRLTVAPRGEPRRGQLPWLQGAICAFAIVATGLVGVRLGSEDDAHRGGMELLYGTGAWQFAIEVCVVFLVLRRLGLRRRDLGLGSVPREAAAVGAAWIFTAAAFLMRDVACGFIGVSAAATDVFLDVFRNGFSEEFLFRGVLLSRLRLALADDWALFVQAAVFAVWHAGADIRAANGDLTVAVCFMITVQGVFGYALGMLALRTRSIAIGSAFHAIADATDII